MQTYFSPQYVFVQVVFGRLLSLRDSFALDVTQLFLDGAEFRAQIRSPKAFSFHVSVVLQVVAKSSKCKG